MMKIFAHIVAISAQNASVSVVGMSGLHAGRSKMGPLYIVINAIHLTMTGRR